MMDPQDAPTVEQLWHRTHVARKAGRICMCCKEPVEPGQKYDTIGSLVDGKFEHYFCHYGAHRYPSGCPKIGALDRAEAEEQFHKDAELWADPKP